MSHLSQAASGDLRAVIEDDAAFRAWFERCMPRVYAYLLSRSGSKEIAEALTQEVFLEAVRRPGSFDGRGDSLPWLMGSARNHLADHVKQHYRDRDRHEQLVREVRLGDSASAAWQASDRRTAIKAALESLPLPQRAVMTLRFLDDLTVKEIATRLGRSEDAVESLLRRARETFERRYREAADAH
ncbi:MAG TPA: sigma-70 family RNA polymerase sigma factor [Candidatus Limnocylindrales bacterium]